MLKGINFLKGDEKKSLEEKYDNNNHTKPVDNTEKYKKEIKEGNTENIINNNNSYKIKHSQQFMYDFLGKKAPIHQENNEENMIVNKDSKNNKHNIKGKPNNKEYKYKHNSKNNTSIEYLKSIDKENNSKVTLCETDFSFDYNTEIQHCASYLFKNNIPEFNSCFKLLEKNYNNTVLNNIHKDKILLKEQFNTNNTSTSNITNTEKNSDTNNNNNKIPKNSEKTEKKEKKSKELNISTHNKTLLLKNCKLCISNKENHKTIIVSSENIFVSIPYYGQITDYHLLLSSHEHYNSSAALEEDTYTELRNYMKSITAFNAERDCSTVFLEYSKSISQSNHFTIEAIPFKHCLIDEVKLFYKKALSEQDSYWSDNKQLVETFNHRGNIKKFLNENFSYLHVDFNCSGGYLHVVSDQSKFDKLFLKEILSVALDKSPFEIKNPPKLSGCEMESLVAQYQDEFRKYDWVEYS
jgi:hypothetical protein